MKEQDFKTVINLLKEVGYDILNFSEHFNVSINNFQKPLERLELAREVIVDSYVAEEIEHGAEN